jgi:hypothetical protein
MAYHAPSLEAARTKQHLQEGKHRPHDDAALIRPVLGFPLVRRVQWTGYFHDALQEEAMVPCEGGTMLGLDKLTWISPAPVQKSH